MKGLNYIIMILLVLTSVQAMTFDKDTTYSEGNINYIFKEGVDIDSFDISAGGIKINGNEEKLGFVIQGGQLDVSFYEFSEKYKTISFKSSVPQTIEFQITSGGVKQYLYDGESYYINSYNIDIEEVEFTYSPKEGDIISTFTGSNSITKLSWWQKKLVEFEIDSTINENGIIENKTFSISYIVFTIILLIIIVLTLIWRISK